MVKQVIWGQSGFTQGLHFCFQWHLFLASPPLLLCNRVTKRAPWAAGTLIPKRNTASIWTTRRLCPSELALNPAREWGGIWHLGELAHKCMRVYADGGIPNRFSAYSALWETLSSAMQSLMPSSLNGSLQGCIPIWNQDVWRAENQALQGNQWQGRAWSPVEEDKCGKWDCPGEWEGFN